MNNTWTFIPLTPDQEITNKTTGLPSASQPVLPLAPVSSLLATLLPSPQLELLAVTGTSPTCPLALSHALPLLRTSFHFPPHPAPYLTGSDKLHLFQALTILVMVTSDVCVAKSRGPFSVQLVHNFFTTCNTSDHACLRETFLFLLASMVPVLLLFHWPLLLNLLIHSFILSRVPSTNIY